MKEKTKELWAKQDQHKGDRWRLFQTVAASFPANKVLYAGSYVDVAPSFVYDDVTYVDTDKRAAAFFSDNEGVKEIIHQNEGNAAANVQFIHQDYRLLDLEEQSFDMLISLYAGFISEPCGKFLRVGGVLLVNSSHGDAALAALDERFELAGVVTSSKGKYKVRTDGLANYLIPKKTQDVTREFIKTIGRGIAYTKPAIAYLFKRTQ